MIIQQYKKENNTLKKTLKIQSKQLKNANELIEDLQKENKTKAYNEAIRKNSLLRDEIKALKEEISCKETVNWFLIAASLGNSTAMSVISDCYKEKKQYEAKYV